MKPWIHFRLGRTDGSRVDISIAEDHITPAIVDAAEDLLHTIKTDERVLPKDLYDLVALAFNTTHADVKARLYRAVYDGKPQPVVTQASDDPEMIAQWIEGYGDEPMDSAIVAQAIRDGKWRAS